MYSARSPEEFAYADELERMAKAGTIELRMTVTRDAAPGDWTGRRGRITRADLQPLVHDGDTLCFVCGPPSLVDEMPQVLESLGVPRERVSSGRMVLDSHHVVAAVDHQHLAGDRA